MEKETEKREHRRSKEYLLNNQQRLVNCMGPHDFNIKEDDALLSDICSCIICGGETQVAYARWYEAGHEEGKKSLNILEEDLSNLLLWLGELTDAVNAADKTGVVVKSLCSSYLPFLSEETQDEACVVLGIEVDKEIDEEED